MRHEDGARRLFDASEAARSSPTRGSLPPGLDDDFDRVFDDLAALLEPDLEQSLRARGAGSSDAPTKAPTAPPRAPSARPAEVIEIFDAESIPPSGAAPHVTVRAPPPPLSTKPPRAIVIPQPTLRFEQPPLPVFALMLHCGSEPERSRSRSTRPPPTSRAPRLHVVPRLQVVSSPRAASRPHVAPPRPWAPFLLGAAVAAVAGMMLTRPVAPPPLGTEPAVAAAAFEIAPTVAATFTAPLGPTASPDDAAPQAPRAPRPAPLRPAPRAPALTKGAAAPALTKGAKLSGRVLGNEEE